MDICVAICTFHRADLLPVTLQSLAAVRRPGMGTRTEFEVLVVDNGAEERVATVVQSFADKLPIRYTSEENVGIAYARNRAIAESRAPVVLFADDDVVFDPGWLEAMDRAIRQQPHCMFWGGRIFPTWDVPQPRWFDVTRCPMLGDSIVRYDLGDPSRPWNPEAPDHDPPFYTANLALRVEAVRQAGMFDVTLGHRGKKRGSGEDSWMIKSIHRAGGAGWYAADAVLHHPVEAKRLTKPYARRFAWRQGKISVEMLRRECDGRTPRWLYRVAAGQIFSGCGRWLEGTFREDPALAFAGQYAMLFNASKIWSALKGR